MHRLSLLICIAACGKVTPLAPDAPPLHADASVAIDAMIDASTNNLTVQRTGAGTGHIMSSPAGIDCGTTCSYMFPPGTQVTLTAMPDSDTTFAGWTGGCTGMGNCVITVTTPVTIGTMFNCSPGVVTYNYSGAINTFTVPACVTSITVDASGAQGGTAGAYAGGLGAHIAGAFTVQGDAQLKVLVGGMGAASADLAEQGGGAGGGGSFVTDSANTPLIVAGGGGGACDVSNGGSCLAAGLGGTTGR